MACKKCGSDWVTQLGDDCVSCPHCCKQQRCRAKKQGRWVEPTQQKTCEECGIEFTAVGLHAIAIQVLCESPSCKAARHKKKAQASAKQRAAGIYILSRETRPRRHCKFSGCGKELTRRGQKEYCGKPCYFAAVDAGEQQFKGRVRDGWAALADWLTGSSWSHPLNHGRRSNYKPRPLCEVCGAECNDMNARFCSRQCTKKWRGPRKCKCGKMVMHATAFGRVYCVECKKQSRRIQRRMYGSYKRRCQTYGGYFNASVKPKDVFVRDRWLCHICLKKTSKVFDLNNPRSATVDHHPIPLSKGGDHDWHNVRCACFECNTIKGNKWDGQCRLAFA